MTKAVFKYTIIADDEIRIPMPVGAEILTVQVQHKEPQLWALVDPSAPLEDRCFRLAGTGHPIVADVEDQLLYINSFQLMGGSLVFHLFERKERQ